MQFLRRMRGWLRRRTISSQSLNNTDYKTTMLLVRKAYFEERHTEALNLLERAITFADLTLDATAKVDVTLTRADILIAQGDYDNAEIILKELQLDSETKQHLTPLAYALSSLGVVAQQRGNLTLARERYEEARGITEQIKADGASGRATAHLADTYLREGNASYALYLLKDAIPKLQQSGDKEPLGYFLCLHGQAQIASGYIDEGIDTIRRGYDVAATMQHRAQIRIIADKLGQAYFEQGKYRHAKQYLEEALRLYPEPPPATEPYIQLLILLSKVCIRMGDDTNTQHYAEKAQRWANEPHLTHYRNTAMALIALAQRKTSEPDTALRQLQEAAANYQENDSFYLEILQYIAELQASMSNFDSAQANYEKVITLGNTFQLQQANAQAGIAELLTLSQQFREAIETHQKALELFLQEGRYGQVAQQYCAIGLLYSRLGDGRMALRPYGDALLLLNRIDDKAIRGAILGSVANAFSDYGDIESAIDYYQEAIDSAKVSAQKAAEATRRGNYGRLLAVIGKPQQAITEITHASTYFTERHMALELAVQQNNLGIAHRVAGNTETALTYQQTALTSIEALNQPLWFSIIQADLADTFYQHGDYMKAQALYTQASTTAENAIYAHVIIQAAIGQINCSLAIEQIDDAATQIQAIESPLKRAYLRRYLAQWYEARSRVHQARGDSEAAQSTWEEAQSLRQAMQMPQIEATWLSV